MVLQRITSRLQSQDLFRIYSNPQINKLGTEYAHIRFQRHLVVGRYQLTSFVVRRYSRARHIPNGSRPRSITHRGVTYRAPRWFGSPEIVNKPPLVNKPRKIIYHQSQCIITGSFCRVYRPPISKRSWVRPVLGEYETFDSFGSQYVQAGRRTTKREPEGPRYVGYQYQALR